MEKIINGENVNYPKTIGQLKPKSVEQLQAEWRAQFLNANPGFEQTMENFKRIQVAKDQFIQGLERTPQLKPKMSILGKITRIFKHVK